MLIILPEANKVSAKTIKIAFLVIFTIFLNLFVAILTFNPIQRDYSINNIVTRIPFTQKKDLKKFSSEDDFKNYLELSSNNNPYYSIGNRSMMTGKVPQKNTSDLSTPLVSRESNSFPSRISDTNTQVIGIDEPDIVKTDGKKIYFSGNQQIFYPMMKKDVLPETSLDSGITFEENQKIRAPYPFPIPQEKTNIINAFPPADLVIDAKIDKQGDLLLNNNILVVFPTQRYNGGKQEISAYDVSNLNSKTAKFLLKKWNIILDDNTSIITSRLKNGKIYLIVKNNINQSHPCPIMPLSIDNFSNSKEIKTVNISCAEIYHPIVPVPVDSTFTAMVLDPTNGKINEKVSFVGSSGSTVIYVSENSIYATYFYNESMVKIFSGFIRENDNFFPTYVVDKINKLNNYDISENGKIIELTLVMEKYKSSLSADDRLKFENEINNRMNDYYKSHSRELEKTAIVKINTDNLTIVATGEVPGHLLNNFSMDEYQGNLRVASTIGSRWGFFGGIGSGESVSDVTILNKNLDRIASVKDLGKTEQIYSVRFIEDKSYVVTFRQTDPFYVLDLANPKKPVLAGELKIPGYSSYLHPLDATHILGIGQEGSQVKISLFDVSDKNNPEELGKYLLDEYWSEVSNNYHAFLLDKKYNIFFLPGSKGGYVFSYAFDIQCKVSYDVNEDGIDENVINDSCRNYLELKKTISQNSVKRAIYLNDYLYIIGDDKISVLDEKNWQKVNELDLKK